MSKAYCYDCHRPYGDEFGFPDLVIDHDAWNAISPTKDEGGLLCPSCICKRLHGSGIKAQGAFTSGPIISVSGDGIWLRNRLKTLEHMNDELHRWMLRQIAAGSPK